MGHFNLFFDGYVICSFDMIFERQKSRSSYSREALESRRGADGFDCPKTKRHTHCLPLCSGVRRRA